MASYTKRDGQIPSRFVCTIYNKKLSKGNSLLRKFILHLYQVLLLIEIGDA